MSSTGGPESTHAAILELIRQDQIDFEKDIILCPRNGTGKELSATCASLNLDIRAIVNPDAVERISAGDRVICTKNFSDLDIWNGTTGRVTAANRTTTWVDLDLPRRDENGQLVYNIVLGREETRALQLAYVLTVHKAQGSQYRRVVFVCLNRDAHSLLDRSLLYTAVTRTKSACIVMGQPSAIQQAISTARSRQTVMQILGA